MTQVLNIFGEDHYLPDEFTQDQIQKVYDQVKHEKSVSALKDAFNADPLQTLPQDFGAGLLNAIYGFAKSVAGTSPEVEEKLYGRQSPNAYQALGMEDKPFYTLGGLAQTAGELFSPSPAVEAQKVASTLSKAYESTKDVFSSGKFTKKLLDELGQGSKNVEENSKSLGNDIRESYNNRNETATSFLNYAMQRAGDDLIYTKPNPLITTAIDKGKAMFSRLKDLNIGDLYDAFKARPSFKNAHNLQSELGVMIRDLESNPQKSIGDAMQISNLSKARDSLKSDIQDFLGRWDSSSNENLKNAYNTGINFYREHVSPYLQTKKLRDIVRNGKETVKNIHDIFGTPSDIVGSEGEAIQPGHITKILGDLPVEAKGKILFSKIGGYRNVNDPTKAVKSLSDALQSAYSKYETPGLQEKLSDVLTKEKRKNLLKNVLKYGGGLGLVGTTTYELGRIFGRSI